MASGIKLRHKLRLTSPQIIVIGFFIVILTGAILLTLPIASRVGHSSGFINALFTATTSTCVTGLVVYDTFSRWTLFGQLVILTLIQVGGLGFMTLATIFSLALRRKINFNERLLISESLSQDSTQGMVRLTKHIAFGTLFFEGAGAIILAIKFIPIMGVGKGIYFGIFHSVSAFCNAGIDLMGMIQPYCSLTPFSSDLVINVTIMALIVIGGLGFAVWEDVYKSSRVKDLGVHAKLVLGMTAGLIVVGSMLIFLFENNNPGTMMGKPVGEKILASFFQSVTARTAGFNTINLAAMKNATVLVLIIWMFIGAAPGSTGGGVKVSTFGVIVLTIWSIIRNSGEVTINKKAISNSVVYRAMLIVLMALGLVAIGTLMVVANDPVSLRQALFEVVSAFGTVGLSLGITPHLSDISKLTLIIIMYLGRVGILTMALSLPGKYSSTKKSIRYPEAHILL